MAATFSVPEDVATAWKAKSVARTVAGGREDDLRGLDSDNKRVLRLDVDVGWMVSNRFESDSRLSSIPTGPISIQEGGLARSKGIQ